MRDAVIEAALDLLLGIGFSVGCIVVYIPQHVNCWKLKSAEGLSIWTILLCTVSNVTLFLASLLEDYPKIAAACDQHNDDRALCILRTINESVPAFQNLLAILTGIPTYAFYYFCFGKPETTSSSSSSTAVIGSGAQHRLEVNATAFTWVLVGTLAAVSFWSLFGIHNDDPSFTRDLMEWLSFTAALANVCQWIPQVECTWSAGHEGVLSVAALAFAVVGDGLLAAFWVQSTKESAWICATLATDAIMQLILIVIIWHYRRKRRLVAVVEQQPDVAAAVTSLENGDLSTPLLDEEEPELAGERHGRLIGERPSFDEELTPPPPPEEDVL